MKESEHGYNTTYLLTISVWRQPSPGQLSPDHLGYPPCLKLGLTKTRLFTLRFDLVRQRLVGMKSEGWQTCNSGTAHNCYRGRIEAPGSEWRKADDT
ncbi:hypothetical protein E2C01_102050 [Portunus trituberculatus]|uniref:Uncharacterized protein n=1 Tax=Portunus trituberculatus TaxID=210409 RepID=A0A5B7KLU9_PORTR|nr:hypothetical protein [Portunus trituberculatus]